MINVLKTTAHFIELVDIYFMTYIKITLKVILVGYAVAGSFIVMLIPFIFHLDQSSDLAAFLFLFPSAILLLSAFYLFGKSFELWVISAFFIWTVAAAIGLGLGFANVPFPILIRLLIGFTSAGLFSVGLFAVGIALVKKVLKPLVIERVKKYAPKAA